MYVSSLPKRILTDVVEPPFCVLREAPEVVLVRSEGHGAARRFAEDVEAALLALLEAVAVVLVVLVLHRSAMRGIPRGSWPTTTYRRWKAVFTEEIMTSIATSLFRSRECETLAFYRWSMRGSVAD